MTTKPLPTIQDENLVSEDGQTVVRIKKLSVALLPDVLSKVAALGPAKLKAVHQFLQRLELASVMDEIQGDAEALRLEGKLEPEVLQAAIREHRLAHSYR